MIDKGKKKHSIINEEEKQEYNLYLYWNNSLLTNRKKQTNQMAEYSNLDWFFNKNLIFI